MEVIYSAFYQVMAEDGSHESFEALNGRFGAGLEAAELSEQRWWELQIRALALGRYDELVTVFGDHHPEADYIPYTLEQIDERHCIEMIDWFSLLATSKVEGFSEWATAAEAAEQQPFARSEPELVVADAADDAADAQPAEDVDVIDLFADWDDDLSDLDEMVGDSSDEADIEMAEPDDLFAELLEAEEDLISSMTYSEDEWDAFFESNLPEKGAKEDKPAHVRVLTLPEVPLDQLEETLSWLDDLVTDEAETGDKSLEAMDFDEALAWFGELEETEEHQPATVYDDDFVSAGMAFESKAADKYYEPMDNSLIDDMPPDDPDAALDWLRELILDMDAPSGFDGDLDEVTAWFEEHRPG